VSEAPVIGYLFALDLNFLRASASDSELVPVLAEGRMAQDEVIPDSPATSDRRPVETSSRRRPPTKGPTRSPV
jgi:hypothetical protein